MAFDTVPQPPSTGQKIRELVGDFNTAGICFDGRGQVILDRYGDNKLRLSWESRYACLVDLCNDRFGVDSPNVNGHLNRSDRRMGVDKRLATLAVESYSGFRSAVAMLSCNGGC